jgi:hypothetical protein
MVSAILVFRIHSSETGAFVGAHGVPVGGFGGWGHPSGLPLKPRKGTLKAGLKALECGHSGLRAEGVEKAFLCVCWAGWFEGWNRNERAGLERVGADAEGWRGPCDA